MKFLVALLVLACVGVGGWMLTTTAVGVRAAGPVAEGRTRREGASEGAAMSETGSARRVEPRLEEREDGAPADPLRPSWLEKRRGHAALLAEGTDEALEEVLDHMRDPAQHYTHRASTMLELLGEREPDARIYAAAREGFEACLAIGVDSWVIGDFTELMARHGGGEATAYFLAQLEGEELTPQLRMAFAKSLAHLTVRTDGPAFLELGRSDDELSSFYFRGLASWDDPELAARLRSVSADVSNPRPVRRAAFVALGSRVADVAALSAFVHESWQATPDGRGPALEGIDEAVEQLGDSLEAIHAVVPILEEALTAEDDDTRQNALWFVKNRRDKLDVTVLDVLRAALRTREDAELGKLIRFVELKLGV